MSELDLVNAKLDLILKLLGPAPSVTPEGPVVDWDGVGDPPSQEAWTKWRNSKNVIERQYYKEVWEPTPKQPDGSVVPAVRAVQAADGHWIGPKLYRGAYVKVQSISKTAISFPIEPEATKFSIVPVGGGYGETYNIWVSDTPEGPATAGSTDGVMRELSSISFKAETKDRFVNLRCLGVDGQLFVQTN